MRKKVSKLAKNPAILGQGSYRRYYGPLERANSHHREGNLIQMQLLEKIVCRVEHWVSLATNLTHDL